MRTFIKSFFAVLSLAVAVCPSRAADPYDEISFLKLGRPNPAIVAVQTEIAKADLPQLRAIEQKLLAILVDPEATPDAKSWVCRTLRTAGSAKSVPALANLLTDKELGADAQFALRSIPGPEATAALINAIAKTEGLLRAGVVQTLGARADRGSVPAITPLLNESDPAVLESALYALGHIGGRPALEALRASKVPPSLERYRLDSLILCAESVLAETNDKAALTILQDAFDKSPDPVIRSAALQGIVVADPLHAEKRLSSSLTDESRTLRSTALRLLAETASTPLIQTALSNSDTWEPSLLASVLNVIANPAALPVALKAAHNQDPTVRAGACAALGRFGTEKEVVVLLAAAVEPEPIRNSARRALSELRGSEVGPELVNAAKGTHPDQAREAIRALAARNYTAAAPALFALTKLDGEVALEAVKASGQLASPADLGVILQILYTAHSEAQQEAAESAIAAVLERCPEQESASAVLVKGMPGAAPSVRCCLLRLLSRVPSRQSLAAVESALSETDRAVEETAIRCLADWPNQAPADDLLRFAQATDNATHRTLAVRGIIRLAALPAQTAQKSVQLLDGVSKMPLNREEKQAVLACASSLKDPGALRLASACLKDLEVETEAAHAVVDIAKRLQATEPDLAAAAIQEILDTCKTATARQAAESAGVILGDMVNIAPQGIASSPDGLEKDGQAGGDQAGIDGDPSSYWDEQDGAKEYRLLVTFNEPQRIAALSIMGYAHQNYAPRDFEVLCDGQVTKTVQNAQYSDNLLVLSMDDTACKTVELKISGYCGASPAIRELGIYQSKANKKQDFRILVFSKTLGFRHANIPLGVAAIRELGTQHAFAVDATEDSGAFTPENLKRYKAVVFLSATGDILNSEQENALKEFVLGGGGFAGIHGALFGPSACEDQWAWYGELCCVSFKNHSAVVPAQVDIEDRAHPSTSALPERWQRTDEWYNYDGTPRGKARVLATIDESTYKGGNVGPDHPIAWCKKVGQGLMWYSAMGHTDESFREPLFLEHVLGGIQFVSGVKPGEFTPNPRPAKP